MVFHYNKAVEKTLFRCLSAVMDYALRVAELGRGAFPLFCFTPAATITEVLLQYFSFVPIKDITQLQSPHTVWLIGNHVQQKKTRFYCY